MLQPFTSPQRAGQVPSTRHAPYSTRSVMSRATKHQPYPPPTKQINTDAPTDVLYDAVVVGGGMGGLTAAAKLAARGAKVVVLEKYLVPGGSAAHFKREGYTFDVGSSMMFGFGDKGTTNLITKALEAVGKRLETVPDPTQVHYHLPSSKAHPEGLSVQVWRNYNEFIAELTKRFPHEAGGIRKFYGECWAVFNALNSLEMKSLEEPKYLMGEFFKNPLACLTLASYVATNTGDVSRKYIQDPDLLKFIDTECFIWSTVSADLTPMINAGMVFCDRHFGGINYPLGGVGRIGEEMAQGIVDCGGHVVYKANVKEIITEDDTASSSASSSSSSTSSGGKRATGVRLADGRVFKGRSVISNATRWDTFEGLLGGRSSSSSSSSSNGSSSGASSNGASSSEASTSGSNGSSSNGRGSSGRSSASVPLPRDEVLFRQRYKKSPSFLSIHMGVRADVLPPDTDVHHIVLEDWDIMEQPRGTLFVSIPTLLDPSLAPEGRHIVHAFTPDWVEAYAGMGPEEYEAAKEAAADEVVRRLEALWPGLAAATEFREVGTPRTHRRYLNREDGTYGPIPSRRPLGMLSMPFNSTSIPGLYCVGDSTFPGQGVNAVVFSGFGVAHRVAVDLGMEPGWPVADKAYSTLLRFVRDRS